MEESIVFRFFLYIITAYIMFSPVAIYNLCKLRKIKQEAARRITPPNSDLWFDLLGTQEKLKIPTQYRLDKETDFSIVIKIIEDYKVKLSVAYFEDRFQPSKTERDQTSVVCFMLSFYDYLDRAKTHDIPGHQDEGFTLAYFKVYYITYLYCKNNPISNPSLFPNWKDYVGKYLISELDKRTF